MEPPNARRPRPLGQRHHERSAHPVALPAVNHLDRHLGHVELVEPDVAGDSDRRSRWRRERDQGLVVPVVDVQEQAEVAGSQRGFRREVALVARALAQVAKREGDRVPIRGDELADRERRHLIPRR